MVSRSSLRFQVKAAVTPVLPRLRWLSTAYARIDFALFGRLKFVNVPNGEVAVV